MAAIRHLNGHGMLRADGKDIGRIEYKLVVSEDQGLKISRGTISGSPAAIREAFEAKKTSILREDVRYEMTIIVTSHGYDGQGAITVSGSPGPWK